MTYCRLSKKILTADRQIVNLIITFDGEIGTLDGTTPESDGVPSENTSTASQRFGA
ncbi:hypothetical protein DSUL_140017 [Desulfovibrionales bacterium]